MSHRDPAIRRNFARLDPPARKAAGGLPDLPRGSPGVHGIVAKHGGFVELKSQVGKGSTFSIYLPSAAAAGAGGQPRRASRSVQGGTESILVVEDEAAVRRMAVRYLRRLGYQVAEAESGVAALKVWEREGGDFDLLFTDMVMPDGLSGLDLCAHLRQRKAGLKAIIASGYSAEIVDDDNLAAQEVTFLSKCSDQVIFGIKVRAGARYDNVRMCVAPAAGGQGWTRC